MLLRAENAALALDMPPESLRSLTRAGKISCVKIGRATYYRLEDLRTFVDGLRGAR